jgi:GNAT superfamily N-acetyltransferase
VLELLLWLLGFSLLLWALLSLFAGRPVNPLGVFLGVLLAPVAFLIGVFLTGAALALLAPLLPWLLRFAAPLALLVGFFFALFTLAALSGVGIGRALLALLLALVIMTLLGAAAWHMPIPLFRPEPQMF